MTDCPICERRPTTVGWLTCQHCPTRLTSVLADITTAYTLLDITPTRSSGQRVTGTPSHTLPLRVDVLDLTMPPHPGSVGVRMHGTWATQGGDPDQVGHLSTLTILDTWVRDWQHTRGQREHLPVPTVPNLTGWLTHRTDWACRYHPAIGEYATDMRHLRAVLHSAAGHVDRPELVPGRCPRCRWRALYRLPGDDFIRCGNEQQCGRMMTPEEYDQALQGAAA